MMKIYKCKNVKLVPTLFNIISSPLSKIYDIDLFIFSLNNYIFMLHLGH